MAQDILTATINVPVPETEQPMTVRLVRPSGAERLPACILFPEIFGLTEHMHEAAQRLARAGLLVAMPDLHHRTKANAVFAYDGDGRERGLALLRTLRRHTVLAELVPQ